MERIFLDKYLRHQSIHWLDQKELFSKKVLLIGIGAIGNELLKNMLLMGIGEITIVDFDKIEIHNLTRSVLFREKDLGKSKVEVAEERAREINPDSKVISIYGDFYDHFGIEELKKFDGVFALVDNFEARIRIHRLCYLAGVDFFNVAMDSQFVSVEYYPYGSKKHLLNNFACFECGLNEKVYEQIEIRYSCGWIQRSAYRERKIPTTIITSSIAGAFALSVFLHKNHYERPTKLFIDTIHGSLQRLDLTKNDHCLFCHNWNSLSILSWEDFLKLQKEFENITLFLNEPILIQGVCGKCGFKVDYYELSRKYKDSDLVCSHCHGTLEPFVKDHFEFSEIKHLKNISFKYAYFFKNEHTYLVVKNDKLEGNGIGPQASDV